MEDVRITAQLVRVADGFHIWSETYDRKLEKVFALQEEIARRIGDALKLVRRVPLQWQRHRSKLDDYPRAAPSCASGRICHPRSRISKPQSRRHRSLRPGGHRFR
jgi:Lon protease-like protein